MPFENSHYILKQILLLVFLVILASYSRGQIPNWTDFKLFAGQSFDYANSIKVDSKDNYYITASSQNPLSPFTNDTLLVKCNFIQSLRSSIYNGILLRYDSARNLSLSITIDNGDLSEAVIDNIGNIYVTGVFQYGAYRDAFVKKFSASGTLLWTKLLQSSTSGGSLGDNVITSIDMFKDGLMIMCGFSYGNEVSLLGQSVSGPYNFITKINSNGDIIWTRNFSSDLGMGAYKVKFDKAGDVLVAGNERVDDSNSSNAIIAKLTSSAGDVIWKRKFLSNGIHTPYANAIGVSGNAYIFSGTFGGQIKIGDSTLVSSGGLDIFLLQSDTAGNIKWVKKAGSTGRDGISDLLTNQDGVTFITGQLSNGFQFNGTSYISKGNTDVLIGAIDSIGNTLWMLTGGSNIHGHNDNLFYDESGGSIAVDSKKQVHVVGVTIGSGSFGGLQYEALEDIRQNGFWLTLGGKAASATVQYPCNTLSGTDTVFTINVNPNPYINNITLSNSKYISIDYKVALYNSLGQQLDSKSFLNSTSVMINEWNTLPAGIYFLKVSTTRLLKTFKLVKR